jgi:hypothetical protein
MVQCYGAFLLNSVVIKLDVRALSHWHLPDLTLLTLIYAQT